MSVSQVLFNDKESKGKKNLIHLVFFFVIKKYCFFVQDRQILTYHHLRNVITYQIIYYIRFVHKQRIELECVVFFLCSNNNN